MQFLPDEVVPDLKRDGEATCRTLLSLIGFYIAILEKSGLSEACLEEMFRRHVCWFREGSLALHERAMMCALAAIISSGSVM